ncbi:hypothetical protein H0H81_000758 [Sphagnurus paluster]|uniref:Terpene synthase n=1 Tax=Sphagnurus paluster TaxID=117069 RepID=A0A9P7KIU5_9AGAR|nr:hypothetical protein H0H81_000758 [Sphagnurus paluster]
MDRASAAHDVLTLDTYASTRRESIGMRPLLDFGRWISKLDIPPHVLSHSSIRKMEDDAIDMFSLTNDLYSYRKEILAHDAHHNFITVAMQDLSSGIPAGDHQAAIDYTCVRFSEILNDFRRLSGKLPSFGADMDTQVQRYIAVMTDLVVGNIRWSLACRRYGHSDTWTDTKTGDVMFDLN